MNSKTQRQLVNEKNKSNKIKNQNTQKLKSTHGKKKSTVVSLTNRQSLKTYDKIIKQKKQSFKQKSYNYELSQRLNQISEKIAQKKQNLKTKSISQYKKYQIKPIIHQPSSSYTQQIKKIDNLIQRINQRIKVTTKRLL